ncbi:hypothetical protein ACQP2T_34010 [Nonomuraea sp. CA-143628]|uniref:hypothetical protein n=1 Tax=Nonomuraea sp. CA-143628 TaxID=3239997 RepID=UPI003D94A60E
MTVGAWRMPLLLAGTLLALSASAPAAADPDPGDVTVKVGVEATVCVDVPLVSVHIGKCAAPAAQPPTVVKPPSVVIVKPRPVVTPQPVATPKVTPRVRVVITPRPAKPKPTQRPTPKRVRVPHIAPQPVRIKPAKPTPKPTPTLKPTPKPPVAYVRAHRAPPPRPRKNPLGTVLLMVVLTTAIASTTAVAFASVR